MTARLRRLLAEATPGPWTNQGYDKHEEGWCLLGGGVPFSAEEHMVAYTPGFSTRAAEDAALVVELRNHADVLLDIAEAAQTYRAAEKVRHITKTVEYQRDMLDAALSRLSKEEE